MFIGRYARLAGFVLIPAALAAIAACGGGDDDEPTPTAAATANAEGFLGAKISPPMPKPDFTLTDTSGEPYDIAAETEGYITLLYVGYTHCPDICPTHMLDIANTLKAMDPADAAQVKVLFITADPARDTPEVMRRWLDLFSTEFVGLTSDKATLDRLQISMGMQPSTNQVTDRSGPSGYEVSHAAYVLAFDKTNVANLAYLYGMEREIWLNDIPKLVREGYKES